MSKVNVDEIKVGDLIGFDNYNKKIALCYVTKIDSPVIGCVRYWGNFSCKKDPKREGFLYDYNVDYHWKVINFEEETKMDELKVYTGKETIEALLEGKVIRNLENKCDYKFEDGNILVDLGRGKGFESSTISVANLITFKFTEVVTPQVGDWVRFKFKSGTYTAKIEKIDDEGYWGEWNQPTSDIVTPIFPYEYVTWEILSPEQVSEYKREQAFVNVGRKPNEFKQGDIVYIESIGKVAVIVSKINETSIQLNGINEEGRGYKAKPLQLRPISFVETQTDLSE